MLQQSAAPLIEQMIAALERWPEPRKSMAVVVVSWLFGAEQRAVELRAFREHVRLLNSPRPEDNFARCVRRT